MRHFAPLPGVNAGGRGKIGLFCMTCHPSGVMSGTSTEISPDCPAWRRLKKWEMLRCSAETPLRRNDCGNPVPMSSALGGAAMRFGWPCFRAPWKTKHGEKMAQDSGNASGISIYDIMMGAICTKQAANSLFQRFRKVLQRCQPLRAWERNLCIHGFAGAGETQC